MVVDSHQEDADGSDGHDRSHYVETEAVHRPGDPTPVVFLLHVAKDRSGQTLVLSQLQGSRIFESTLFR